LGLFLFYKRPYENRQKAGKTLNSAIGTQFVNYSPGCELWVVLSPDSPQIGAERRQAKEEIMEKAKDIILWVTVGFFVVLYLAITIPVYG
jgi:hypothetical protein